MRKRVTTGTFVALACSAMLGYSASAQQPDPSSPRSPSQPGSPQSGSPQSGSPQSGSPQSGSSQPGSPQSGSSSTTRQSGDHVRTANNEVTIAGCILPGTSPNTYVLTSTTGAGSGSAGGSGERARQYELVARNSKDLSKRIGKRVEVTGTAAESAATTSPGSTSSPDAAGDTGSRAPSSNRGAVSSPTAPGSSTASGITGSTRFTVKSVRQVAGAC